MYVPDGAARVFALARMRNVNAFVLHAFSVLIFGDARYPGLRAARSTPGCDIAPILGAYRCEPRIAQR